MTHEQLVDYIKKAKEHGMGDNEVRANLTKNGWDAASIDAGFAEVAGAPAVPPAPSSGPLASAAPSDESNPLPSAVAMWKRAWRIFRSRMGVFFGIAAVPAVVSAAFQAYAQAYPKSYGWSLLLLVVVIVVQLLTAMAYIYAASDGEADIGKAYASASKKFFKMIWLVIISTIVVGGLTCLGFIPGIIVGVWFIFSIYVLTLENQGGMNALFISREYVRGKWWPALGYPIFPALIVGLIAAIANGILGALQVPYYQAIVSLVLAFLFTPTIAIYNYLVYVGFKKAKGPVAPIVTTGRKAKYVVLALVGYAAIAVMIGSSFVMLFSAFKNLDKGKLPINGASQNMPSSEELNRLMQQFQNINANLPPTEPFGWNGNIP